MALDSIIRSEMTTMQIFWPPAVLILILAIGAVCGLAIAARFGEGHGLLFAGGSVFVCMLVFALVAWTATALTLGRQGLHREAKERETAFATYERLDPTFKNWDILCLDFAHSLPVDREPDPEDAGTVNAKIAQWVLKKDSHRLLAQPAIYLVAGSGSHRQELVLIHPHIGGVDIDTSRTIRLAWPILNERPRVRILVASHPLQAERAIYVLKRLCMEAGRDCEVVAPEIVAAPYFSWKAQQWRCKAEIFWLTWELLLARPATYFGRTSSGGVVQGKLSPPEPPKTKAARTGM